MCVTNDELLVFLARKLGPNREAVEEGSQGQARSAQPLDQMAHGFSPERATETGDFSVALSEFQYLGSDIQGLRASRLPLATLGRTFGALFWLRPKPRCVICVICG